MTPLNIGRAVQQTVDTIRAHNASTNWLAETIADTTTLVQSIWPKAQLVLTGSVACNVHCLNSDVDFWLVGVDAPAREQKITCFEIIMAQTKRTIPGGIFACLTQRFSAGAPVPVLALRHTQIDVDIGIAFMTKHTRQHMRLLHAWTQQYTMFAPLLIFFKTAFRAADLLEARQGGIGSTALASIIVFVLLEQFSQSCSDDQRLIRPYASQVLSLAVRHSPHLRSAKDTKYSLCECIEKSCAIGTCSPFATDGPEYCTLLGKLVIVVAQTLEKIKPGVMYSCRDCDIGQQQSDMENVTSVHISDPFDSSINMCARVTKWHYVHFFCTWLIKNLRDETICVKLCNNIASTTD